MFRSTESMAAFPSTATLTASEIVLSFAPWQLSHPQKSRYTMGLCVRGLPDRGACNDWLETGWGAQIAELCPRVLLVSLKPVGDL